MVYLGAGMDELVASDSEIDPIEYDKKAREALYMFPYTEVLAVDRCFGAFALDTRMPFLERDLVDFYFRMPVLESRENMEKCLHFSLALANPFVINLLDWDIVKCKPKSPFQKCEALAKHESLDERV